MSTSVQRRPLGELQNDRLTSAKPPKTYGKRAKPLSARTAAKEIFVSTAEIENSLESMSLVEKPEETHVKNLTINKQKSETEKTSEIIDRRSAEIHGPSREAIQSENRTNLLDEARSTQSPDQESCISATSRPSSKQTTKTENHASRRKARTLDERLIEDLACRFSDRQPLSFESYGRKIARACDVVKIGEGTYSSVFALTRKPTSQDQQDPTSVALHDKTILKMMPILLPSMGDQEGQTEPIHIANELQTMQLVDSVHGFIRYRGLTIVHGLWPSNFLAAFRRFKTEHRKKAENEDPEEAYGATQFYALIEMEDAGLELSDVLGGAAAKRPSDFQMWDVLMQTCVYLAHAEAECAFEHRDLHVSNICIKPRDTSSGAIDLDPTTAAHMKSRPKTLLGVSNIAVTIIDYTFSRATLPQPDMKSGKQVNFREFELEGEGYESLKRDFDRDLKKIGNSGEKYESHLQQLTYAKVAQCVAEADEEAVSQEGPEYQMPPWERSVPRTNACWLGYLAACLLSRAGKTVKTKYIPKSSDVARRVQDEIRSNLVQLKDLLLTDDKELMPRSADDVLRIAIEKGWLSRAELDDFKSQLEELA